MISISRFPLWRRRELRKTYYSSGPLCRWRKRPELLMGDGAISPCRRSCLKRSHSHTHIHLFHCRADARPALPRFQVEVYFTHSLNLICYIFSPPPPPPPLIAPAHCCGVARGDGLPARLTSTLFWCRSQEMWSSFSSLIYRIKPGLCRC